MTQTFSDQAECCHGVCKPSSTAMFDNADSPLEFKQDYPSQSEAEQALAWLIEKVRNVESEPCQIESQIQPTEQGVQLHAKFVFCCQAETVLFQLALR
ncbi:hypothetical protein A4G19_05195 [Pasteurellaceae bacterium Macca]|nr:hypothetical protein [Pasteurellaceae bacterium Macca]